MWTSLVHASDQHCKLKDSAPSKPVQIRKTVETWSKTRRKAGFQHPTCLLNVPNVPDVRLFVGGWRGNVPNVPDVRFC